ncbi:MAG: MptD family putative ECF transporter S component [Peptostreptococcaceae bacterium]|jgi:energy-coupling factor transport system substrate-specific component|nr:MptD family putative ECF transporter S component [Peptostreptococcaceae bacterium]
MKEHLQTKDLITTGIFTAIYFILFFAVGMLGYIPIFFILLPFILPIISGIPFMLFLTKVKCFGMVSIMGMILGILMTLTGHTYTPIISGVIFGILADLILKLGAYKSKKISIFGYGIFSMWLLGMLAPFWLMKDSFERIMKDSMGSEYTKIVFELFDKIFWYFPLMAFLGGIIGAFFGLKMLKKHFKRAGIA